MDKICILIADDSLPFRQGLSNLLHSVDDLEVVGEAASGDETIRLAEKLQPDVILMDLQMPGTNGIEATRQILHTSPHIRVLVLTMFEDDDSVFAALRAGALGYLLKGALKSEIVRAIRSVTAGEAIFGPAIAKKLMQYFSTPRPAAPPQVFPELTEREREILNPVAQHLTNPEIAECLSLSQKTVRNHVSNIFTKLQVADRAQAIVRARQAGLGNDQHGAPSASLYRLHNTRLEPPHIGLNFPPVNPVPVQVFVEGCTSLCLHCRHKLIALL